MARRCRGALVPIKSFIFGVIAISLSFTAYAKRIKQEDVMNINGICTYPSSSACALGTIAALALLAEQVTISVGMSCFCCCGLRCSSKCTSIIAIILYILSWLSFIIAFTSLIYTAILNSHKYLAKHHPKSSGVDDDCFIGIEEMFLGAASWSIITTIFGIISYAFWACGASNMDYKSANYMQGSVDMELPHRPLSKRNDGKYDV